LAVLLDFQVRYYYCSLLKFLATDITVKEQTFLVMKIRGNYDQNSYSMIVLVSAFYTVGSVTTVKRYGVAQSVR
jgi:hypothetical protein